MTITIHPFIIYYCLFTLAYEAIYILYSYKQAMKSQQAQQFLTLMKDYYNNSPSVRMVYKTIMSPAGFIFAFIIVFLVSPFMFPFSLYALIKKLFGIKSNLEKEAEKEAKQFEELKKRQEEFMKTEGIYEEDIKEPTPSDPDDQDQDIRP